MNLFQPKPATPSQCRAFKRILWALLTSQCPYKLSSFFDLKIAANRFWLVSRNFRRFRLFCPGSACFSTLPHPQNLSSWVKYYGKLESFGKEFRWTEFIAVERVGVEFLLKTFSGYPKDTGVTLFTFFCLFSFFLGFLRPNLIIGWRAPE